MIVCWNIDNAFLLISSNIHLGNYIKEVVVVLTQTIELIHFFIVAFWRHWLFEDSAAKKNSIKLCSDPDHWTGLGLILIKNFDGAQKKKKVVVVGQERPRVLKIEWMWCKKNSNIIVSEEHYKLVPVHNRHHHKCG